MISGSVGKGVGTSVRGIPMVGTGVRGIVVIVRTMAVGVGSGVVGEHATASISKVNTARLRATDCLLNTMRCSKHL
jgi:hypothetical protein